MAHRIGLDMKLYRNTGSYAAPMWTEMTNVKDLTRTREASEADVTTRGNSGERAIAQTLRSTTLEFQMVYDPTDADLIAIESAYEDGTVIEFAAADGDIATGGTRYFRFEGQVFTFTQTEALEEAVMVDVTLKPTWAVNAAPTTTTVGGS